MKLSVCEQLLTLAAVVVFAAGFGTRVSTLSLITAWADQDVRARVFSLTTIAENAGKLCAEPILLKIFAHSLSLPKYWLGLPFFTAAVSSMHCSILVPSIDSNDV